MDKKQKKLINLLRLLKQYDLYLPSILKEIQKNYSLDTEKSSFNFAYVLTIDHPFGYIIDILWLKTYYAEHFELICDDVSRILYSLYPDRPIIYINNKKIIAQAIIDGNITMSNIILKYKKYLKKT